MEREFAVIEEQGRRSSMEDAHELYLNFDIRGWIFGGVYDGHGGRAVSDFLKDRMAAVFAKQLRSTNPKTAFIRAYKKCDKEVAQLQGGAAAANFLLKGKRLWYANAGDVRIIVIGKTQVRQLTTDHRISDLTEQGRILQAGGYMDQRYVWHGNYGLMMTRSVGDQHFKSVGVIATPYTSSYKLAKTDLYLVIDCDGLFDYMSNEDVARVIRASRNLTEAAEHLKDEVLGVRNGRDNLTTILLKL